jgi:hypothetical protein
MEANMSDRTAAYEGDFVAIASCTTPTEAHLLKETLIAAGLRAEVADANFIQANSWMSSAVGGVRVLVPASLAAEAKAAVDAFNAGAYQLDASHGTAAEESTAATTPSDSKLRSFQIFHHKERKPAVIAVKQGFSWAAFIVGPLWFLLNGMWMTFLLSLSFTWGAPLVIRSLAGPASSGAQQLAMAAFLAIWVLTGFVANFLLGEELKRKGYTPGPVLRARSAGEAINASHTAA